MKAKFFVNGFVLYFLFAIIGSNLYIAFTGLSFGNFALLILSITLLFNTEVISLNPVQKSFLIPLLLFIVLVTIYFIGFFDAVDSNIIAKYFYLSNIPLLLIIIFSLGNKYGDYFFLKVYLIIKIILLLLAVVVLIELVFNIHMPTYDTEERIFNIPAAFFINSNDVGAVVVSIYLLFIGFNKLFGNRKDFFLFTILTGFLVVVTFSRLSFIVLILIFPFYFITIRRKSLRFVIISIVAIASLILVFSTIIITYIPNKEIDQFGWINNRLLSIKDKEVYDSKGSSSFAIRYTIYSYPFKNPEKFIIGNGINGDQRILKNQIRWSGITNAHSFFMEVVYDFGWLGFLIIVWFFVTIIIFAIKNIRRIEFRFALLFVGSFIILINISSSIFAMPLIWIPLFVYLSYLTAKTNKTPPSISLKENSL